MKPAIVIFSTEGTLQGHAFGANNYAMAMMPLAEGMRIAVPQVLQPWFVDNLLSEGAAEENAACLEYLCTHGPRYDYFSIPAKSWYICKDVGEERAREAFIRRNFPFQMTCGKMYIGGFVRRVE